MATLTPIDLLIETSKSASNLREIRTLQKQVRSEMLALGDEGGAEFDKLAAASAELDDRLEDVRDRIDQMNPDKFTALDSAARIGATGIQVVSGAMALFGAESEDAQKQLVKLQAAMNFAQGLTGIKELGKEFKNLWKSLITNPFAAVTAAIGALVGGLVALNSWMTRDTEEVKRMTAALDAQKKANEELAVETEQHIALLEAQGGKERDVYNEKKNLLRVQLQEILQSVEIHKAKVQQIQDNDDLEESILRTVAASLRSIGATEKAEFLEQALQKRKAIRAQEDAKAAEEDFKRFQQLKNDLAILEANEDNRQAEAGKKASEERRKTADEEWQAIQEQSQKELEAAEAHHLFLKSLEDERLASRVQNAEGWIAIQAEAQAELEANEAAHQQRQIDQEKAVNDLKKKLRLEDLQIASNVLGELSDLTADQAELSKFFAASQTTVDTYLAAQKAFTSQLIPGDPTAPVRAYVAAAAAIVSGLARVRRILSTNMKNPGGASVSTGGGGGFSTPNFAAINQEPAGTQPTTPLDVNGNPIQTQPQQNQTPIPAVVMEGQATDVHRRAQLLYQSTISQ